MPSFRGSPWPRDQTQVFFIAGRFFTTEPPGKPHNSSNPRWTIIYLLYLPIPNTSFRRRQWHPTPVLLPRKSHGRRSLVGCSPWGRYKSDTTERLHFHFSLSCIGEGNGNPLQCSCLEKPREPGGLLSMGSRSVGHNWRDLAAAAAIIKWQNKKILLQNLSTQIECLIYF